MTKLTRANPIQWNGGIMLGWNSSGTMNGIIRSKNKGGDEPELLSGIKMTPDNNISTFFPSNDGTNKRKSNKAPSRPRTRKGYFEPQKDFSPEFLEYIRSFSKRDFEHADDTEKNHLMQTLLLDNNNNNPPNKQSPTSPRSRPASAQGHSVEQNNITNTNGPLMHGYQFLIPTIARDSSRPSTVPRYQNRKADPNNRGVLRQVEGIPATTTGTEEISKVKALTKTRVTPSQLDNTSGNQQGNVPSQSFDETSTCASSFSGTPSERPSSAASSTSGQKKVTFAADVVNYERENKPSKKRKMPKRRRQGFPHPSRGIFVPPEVEILESTGPTAESCKKNPYLNYNQVWTHPAGRSSGESGAGRVIRQERFHRLMLDLEHAHVHYNRILSTEQNDYLIKSIFKRYILVMDLALTEGHLTQVEHLLETISKSVPVLQQNTFYYVYGHQIVKDLDQSRGQKMTEEHPDLVLTRYALSRISGKVPRAESGEMSIETVLVKLLLELIELVFSHYGSYEFRNALNTVPYTVRRAITLLKELRNDKDNKDNFCYVKWINNSAAQRDFRSVLKNLGMLDKFGCKADICSSSSSAGKLNVFGASSKSKMSRNSGHAISKRLVRTPPKPIPEMMMQAPQQPTRPSSS